MYISIQYKENSNTQRERQNFELSTEVGAGSVVLADEGAGTVDVYDTKEMVILIWATKEPSQSKQVIGRC
jgi:hypothetical protein